MACVFVVIQVECHEDIKAGESNKHIGEFSERSYSAPQNRSGSATQKYNADLARSVRPLEA